MNLKKRIIKDKSKLEKIYENNFRKQGDFALHKLRAWEEIKKEVIEDDSSKIKYNLKVLANLP